MGIMILLGWLALIVAFVSYVGSFFAALWALITKRDKRLALLVVSLRSFCIELFSCDADNFLGVHCLGRNWYPR